MSKDRDDDQRSGMFYQFGRLSSAIDTIIGCYREERQQCLEKRLADLCPDAREAIKGISQMADAFMRGAGDLASSEGVPKAQEFFRYNPTDLQNTKLFELMDEHVEMQLGSEACSIICQGPERMVKLFLLSQDIEPSWRAAAFLKRVSRCYIYGFMPECVILCRSALDAELEAEIPNDECITVLGPRRPLYFSLDDRIAVAQKLNRITFETAKYARDVKDLGNRTVHRDPTEASDALQTIAQTLSVIRELSDRA